MKPMKWTQRICIGAGLAVTSLLVVPTVAGADATCYTNCQPPAVSPSSVPISDGTGQGSTAASTTNLADGSSSLPFTGADIGELAAVGVGAVVIGGVLTRRRRRTA